ncbi:hypothetical protein INS49_003404 [Diaporthe citri]|uniref:uncharacterized protein n=1 Tax=Diaporthe citri TaxID=83186 RepID=UPI001C802F88|nr:uncharacterized protein INS49_003404 [Diaporthe citri]KAG6355442.1 hypothetical protein INS49_003404 [Diaporthe citri]
MSGSRSLCAAVISGSVLSGAMLSLSGIAVPVLLETATDAPQLLCAWTRMYHYGHLALPTMGVGACLLYLSAAWRTSKSRGALAAAALVTVAMVPFTWVFMGPLNGELFRLQAASTTDPAAIGLEGVRDMVIWWSRLHVTRSLMPL